MTFRAAGGGRAREGGPLGEGKGLSGPRLHRAARPPAHPVLSFATRWDEIPKEIADPEATVPDDWDEADDGEWEPPNVPNPEYKGDVLAAPAAPPAPPPPAPQREAFRQLLEH